VRVLVDTPIWSSVFRRRTDRLSASERQHVDEWTALVQQRRILLVGPVRQEVLSGIRDGRAFDRLRLALRAFPDEALSLEDFEEAARAGHICRAAGVAGSTVDYLLCGVALRAPRRSIRPTRTSVPTPGTCQCSSTTRTPEEVPTSPRPGESSAGLVRPPGARVLDLSRVSG
jgi:predicted nucleic acid-binding protein